jgi:hypothetical protein
MTRLFLIIVMITQLGCTIVLETAAGSLIGNIGAEIIKQEFNKADDEKEKHPKK